MTNNEKNEIAKLLTATAKSFDKDLSPDVVSMMVGDLEDLPAPAVKAALESYRKNPKSLTWPRVAQIRAIVNPVQSPESLANEAASRIRQAISDFGWIAPVKARAFIGELGWKVVERSGGWQYLCENHGVELSPLTFHAQARDLARALVESANLDLFDKPVQIPHKDKSQLESAGAIVKSLLDHNKK